MAERYDFYVHDNRKITFNLTEPIMREDSGVTDFVFHIPKTLNELEVSDWAWWLVFVNANKEKYSIALTLSDDPESPLEKNVATYTVDYAMSIKAGNVQFAFEAINAGTGGAIDNEWHTQSYEIKVKETLQGNQAEYAETEHDIISALITEYQNLHVGTNQITDGAVTFAKLANDAVTSVKIADGAITNGKIAPDSISTSKVQDGSITEVKLAAGAVTNGKLASNSVSTANVQDRAITEAKLGKDIYLDKYRNVCAVPDTNVLLADIGIDYTQLYTLQGGCYNSNNNHIILAFHKADNPDCIVKELDKDWNLLKTATLTLYHANDITYNEKTDKYYVADGENQNIIYEVNANLSTVNQITIQTGNVIAQISYDSGKDIYYLLSGRKIYTCDSGFNNVTYYAELDVSNDYSGVQSIYTGGSCMIGDSFVSMIWFYRDSEQPESNTRLYFANADKDYVGYYFDFRSHTTPDEQEALLEFPDKIVCIGYYSDNITRSNIYKNGMRQDGMVCLIGNTYSNVNRIPVNSYGVCTIKASSSPTGEDITGAYICYGKYDMRTLRLTVNDVDYYRYCYASGTWTAWHNNKEVLNSLIVSESLTIATGETIAAGSSSSEYTVEIPAKTGYTPFLAVHRSVTAPVIFEWYMYLVADSSKASGYVVKCRYRNTGTTQQTNQNIYATVYYVRTT